MSLGKEDEVGAARLDFAREELNGRTAKVALIHTRELEGAKESFFEPGRKRESGIKNLGHAWHSARNDFFLHRFQDFKPVAVLSASPTFFRARECFG